MSDQTHPVVMCDGEGGMCGAVELDITLGGLGRIIGSESQLPDGWTGARPGDGGEHYCPDCTRARADAMDDGRTGGYYDAGRHIIRRLDVRADRIAGAIQLNEGENNG